jgi:hypothetical protein
MSDTRSGVERIADERLRQIMTEGYSAEHDDGHIHGELAMAAACYAAPERLYEMREAFCDPWPFDEEDDKRQPPDRRTSPEARIRLLEKAGALIAAEIDRLLRKKTV